MRLAFIVAAIIITAPPGVLGQATGENRPTRAERTVRGLERMYRDAIMRQDVAAVGRILADDFLATSSRGEIRDKVREMDDIKPSPDFKMEGFSLPDRCSDYDYESFRSG